MVARRNDSLLSYELRNNYTRSRKAVSCWEIDVSDKLQFYLFLSIQQLNTRGQGSILSDFKKACFGVTKYRHLACHFQNTKLRY